MMFVGAQQYANAVCVCACKPVFMATCVLKLWMHLNL